MPTKVVNRATHKGLGVSIMRPGPWGNPFKVQPYGQFERGAAVKAFEHWVRNSADPRAEWIRKNVHVLKGQTLICCCKPLACHGDVLAAMAEETT